MNKRDYRQAFTEGFRARRERAVDINENPHPAGSDKGCGWEDGWQVAWDEDGRIVVTPPFEPVKPVSL